MLPVFHQGAVIHSHVDDNLIVINSHAAQLEPQQVCDADRGHRKWITVYHPDARRRVKNSLIDSSLLLERGERGRHKEMKPCCFNTVLSGHLSN